MPAWLERGEPTADFLQLSPEMQRLALARYICRVSFPQIASVVRERHQNLRVSRLKLLRSALALLGKSIRPDLQWPDEPTIGMAASGRDFEDHSDFMGSILFLNSLHRDPAAPNYSGIARDYDLRAVGKNVT